MNCQRLQRQSINYGFILNFFVGAIGGSYGKPRKYLILKKTFKFIFSMRDNITTILICNISLQVCNFKTHNAL